jgi:hypothetical protein
MAPNVFDSIVDPCLEHVKYQRFLKSCAKKNIPQEKGLLEGGQREGRQNIIGLTSVSHVRRRNIVA